MAKITKKSVNAVLDIYTRNTQKEITYKLQNPEDDTVVMETHIKTTLSIPEQGMFIDRVISSCFDADGDFMPQYLDPIFAITLLQMTTDIPPLTSTISLKDESGNETGEKATIIDIEKTYELCKAINLIENIKDKHYQNLVHSLKDMVNDKLLYFKQIAIRRATNPANDFLAFLDRLRDSGVIDSMNTEIGNVSDKLNHLVDAPNLTLV